MARSTLAKSHTFDQIGGSMLEYLLNLESLFEFSRCHCIAICAFLVPANLLSTSATLALTGLRRPAGERWSSITIASFFAVTMMLHVVTWFVVGVVMVPTYILMALGSLCLIINLGALAQPKLLARWLTVLMTSLMEICTRVDVPLFLKMHE